MVVFSKTPFTQDEIGFLSNSFAKYGYKPILIPGQVMQAPYADLLSGKVGLDRFYNSFQTKAYPVSDNSPYFLSYEKPFPAIIQRLLDWSVVIVILFLAIPFVWMRSRLKESATHAATFVPYFAALGMGFILIELGLMQKLILLLGNPTMTFALLLFTLLLSSGSGSFLSSRIVKNSTRSLAYVIFGITIIGALYAAILPSVIYSVIGQQFAIKATVSILVLAPVGFLMGMPMPTGIRLLKSRRQEYVSWMWAINGAFSVLGAVISVVVAIMYGSSEALMLGISIYVAALAVSFMWKQKLTVSAS